jgi:hypothetical protein
MLDDSFDVFSPMPQRVGYAFLAPLRDARTLALVVPFRDADYALVAQFRE